MYDKQNYTPTAIQIVFLFFSHSSMYETLIVELLESLQKRSSETFPFVERLHFSFAFLVSNYQMYFVNS